MRFLLAIRERTRLDGATLTRFPALELLLQTGGHAYHVDRDELRRRGVVTALGRRAQVVRAAMPELTFMLAIACLRRLGGASRQMSSGEWSPLTGRLLAGRRLGILGLDRHGRNVARLGQAFAMDVVAWDGRGEDRIGRTASARPGPDGIPLLPLAELLRSSDVVTVHLRLSEESRGLLDRARLQSMKPRSVLVNAARGAIIEEEALVEALRFAGFVAIAAEQVRDYLAGVLRRDELLDPDIEPAPGGLGGLTRAGSR